ncbi:MAG: (5-formylfuran-3-yl)methyl phosphate synthase, partial [Planctomyces sp.]
MTVRLLVSVRSPDEAVVAAAGGADIIDVKEPHHGSLGRPSARTAGDIRTRLTEHCGAQVSPPLSCALGELLEWPQDLPPDTSDFPETALTSPADHDIPPVRSWQTGNRPEPFRGSTPGAGARTPAPQPAHPGPSFSVARTEPP